MGDPNLHTPQIDRMACEGLVLNGVAGTPLCCPYRGSLLTGRYPHDCVPGHQCRMPPEMPTVAHAFAEAGYHTAYIGKWHLDGCQEALGRTAFHLVPPSRRGGFHRWAGYENNNSQWDCWIHGDPDFLRSAPGADAGTQYDEHTLHYRLPGYETDALTDLFIAHLRDRARCPDQPFFAALSVQPPHDPFMAPARWMDRHTPGRIELRANVPPIARVQEQARRNLAGYYAMIENLDASIGRIREALAELKLEDDTLIVFFSDHGEMAGSHGQFAKLVPWEESIRVPFIVSPPRPFYEHRHAFLAGTGRPLINHVDVAPTSLGLCGIAKPPAMAGFDYSYLLRPGAKAPPGEPDSAFLQSVIPTGHANSLDRPWRGIVSRDGWKYVCIERQPLMLFNLNEDPYELANYACNRLFKAERRRLHDRLAQWIADTGDHFDLPDL